MMIIGSDNRNLFRKAGGQLFDFDPSRQPPTPDEYGQFGSWVDVSKHKRVMSSEDAHLDGGGDRHWRMDTDLVDSEGKYDGIYADISWGEVANSGQHGLVFARDRYIEVPPAVFDTVDNEITIVAYLTGAADWEIQSTLFYGTNGIDNNRILSSHLPWDNNTYMDFGNDGGSFDRISDTIGDIETFRRDLIRWTFTKNAVTGVMKIYRDGYLWLSGTGKTRDMTGIEKFIIGMFVDGSKKWSGSLMDFMVYDREINAGEAFYLRGDGIAGQTYPKMDFSTIASLVYGGSQETGVENVLGSGIGVEHVGGLRRTYAFGVSGNDITPHTYLEFDFESTVEGELHAIGYDSNLTDTWSQIFQLFGTVVSNAHQDFNDYQLSDGVKHYKIPLGQIAGYDGNEDRLVLLTDSTNNLAVSKITNIRIYNEVRANPLNDEVDFSVTVPAPFGEGGTGVTEEVLDSGKTFHMIGNMWRSITADHVVTADTLLEFDFWSNNEGEHQTVSVLNENVDPSGDDAKGIHYDLFGTEVLPDHNGTYRDYPGQETFLTPESVVATSELDATRGAVNLINGSGLTGTDETSTHDNDTGATSMWLTANTVVTADLVFDFGRPVNLKQIHLWQYNHNHVVNAAGIRGVATFDIYTSNDGVAYTQAGTTRSLLAANGSNAVLPSESKVLDVTMVRYVKISILTNHGATDGVGLSEVRFSGIEALIKHYSIPVGAIQNGVLTDNKINHLGLLNSAQDDISDTSLIGQWKLDEASGLTASDSSGNANHGTSTASVQIGQPGRLGLGYKFNGVDGRIDIPSPGLNSNTVSIVGWVKASAQVGDWIGLFQCEGVSTRAGLLLRNNRELRYMWNNGGFYTWGSGLVVPLDQWVLVGLTIEPTKATIYLHNGVSLQSSVNVTTHNSSPFNGTIVMGADRDIAARYYNGYLDDFRLYNRTLTSSEIEDHYQFNPYVESYFSNIELKEPQVLSDDVTDPSLRLWYKLNETSGFVVSDASSYGHDGELNIEGHTDNNIDFSTKLLEGVTGQDSAEDITDSLLLQVRMDKDETNTVTDVTGNGRDASYVGDPTWQTHAIGGALSLDGNDALEVDYVPPLTEYAVSVWFKTTVAGGLFYVGDASSSKDRDIWINGDGTVGTLLWTNSNNRQLISSGTDYRDGLWHNVVVTVGSSVGGRKMYVDKALVASDIYSYSDFTWATRIQFGHSLWSNSYLTGEIRDCRMYDRTLVQTDVDRIHEATISESVKIQDSGLTINLTNNSWKTIAFPYVVTLDTIIEFDFESAIEGEQHSVYFANGKNDLADGRRLQLYGTQLTDADQTYHDYAGETPKHYVIPVGQHYTGTFTHLTFQMDDDASPYDGESIFSNVRVYEADSSPEYTTGRLGNAIKFNGTNQVECGDSVNLSGTDLTWIFDIKTTGREQVIFQRGGSTRGYTFYVDAKGYLAVHVKTGQFTDTLATSYYVADGVWHTVGISAIDWYLYIMIDSKWVTESNIYREFNGDPGNGAYIGGHPTGAASYGSWEGHMFIGEIDNFRLFTKYMDSWELCARMKLATIDNSGIKLPDEAYQPIDGNSGGFATHGTIMAAVQMPVGGNGFGYSKLMGSYPWNLILALQQWPSGNNLGFTKRGVADWSVTQTASDGELLVVSWTSNPGDNLIHIGKNDLARETLDVGADYQLPVGILGNGPAGFTVRRLCGWSEPMDEGHALYYRKQIMKQIGI